MSKKASSPINIAIFASGSGSNAEAIVHHFELSADVRVELIVTNRSGAGVIERAERLNIDWAYVPKSDFEDEELVLAILEEHKIDWIILAGWLLLVPAFLIKGFNNRIVNIHPALLPKHGGKGMYGRKVHEAVKAAGDVASGITIHFVNERFDEGKVIAQFSASINHDDTIDDIEQKVRQLELDHYPPTIEKLLLSPQGSR
jgi:phosphoribosylglycinamide formyltransferase 1